MTNAETRHRPSCSRRFAQYGLDRVGCLALILRPCRCVDELEVIFTWRLGISGAARLSHSYKSGAQERRWPTQAQLTRREFVETSIPWAGSVSAVLCCYLREEGESAFLCLVSVLVSQPVLWCSVMWRLGISKIGRHYF